MIMKELKLSIVVPTYEERDNILEFIQRTESTLVGMDFEIVVVDDNSPDRTADIAEKLNEEYGNIRVLRRPKKLGLGSAIVDGIKIADSCVIAVMDADLQHPPEMLPRLLKKIEEGHDIVIASRYVRGGGIEGWSTWRKVVSRGARMFAHLLLPRVRFVKDPVSGFFMFKKDVIDNIEIKTSGYKVLVELLAKGKYNSVAEVPYVFVPRARGKSKLSPKEIASYLSLLLKLKMSK